MTRFSEKRRRCQIQRACRRATDRSERRARACLGVAPTPDAPVGALRPRRRSPDVAEWRAPRRIVGRRQLRTRPSSPPGRATHPRRGLAWPKRGRSLVSPTRSASNVFRVSLSQTRSASEFFILIMLISQTQHRDYRPCGFAQRREPNDRRAQVASNFARDWPISHRHFAPPSSSRHWRNVLRARAGWPVWT
jgi:hypothetical protein